MTRTEIMEIVIENIRMNVDGLEDVDIDPSKPMAEYGASSLDIVEVVSSSMRELRIRVPRTQLAKLNDINELVDLFSEVKNASR